MKNLTALVCEQCGGHIDQYTLTCKMCGCSYMLDQYMQPIRIETSHLQFETVSGCVSVPEYVLTSYGHDVTKATEFILHDMASRMAEKILPLIEWQTEYNPRTMEYITHGRIRVAKPTIK